jgi:glycine C-acetyltransferase
MPVSNFNKLLEQELERLDKGGVSKRHERVVERYEDGRAIIDGKKVLVFNSNDYLGLRFHEKVKAGEHAASDAFGTGPGAVRFIAGTMKVHQELETALAKFHEKEAAMVFSSAFAANMAVLHCLLKGQAKDSLVHKESIIISDQLNHRSIIDGIRVAGFPKEKKKIFNHLDLDELKKVLEESVGQAKRVIVVTDGIFSMLGEAQDIGKIQEIVDQFQDKFEEGVITVVDDSHGVGCYGPSGKGCEEATNGNCDLIVGTLGKGFGVDGGYIVGSKIIIDYLREAAATYIYSNPVAPGTAGAALAAVNLMMSDEGKQILATLNENIAYLKKGLADAGFEMAAPSEHPIQPLLVGDPLKSKALTEELFANGILVTPINYPVVPSGKDEIRVQVSAAHSTADIDEFIEKVTAAAKKIGLL